MTDPRIPITLITGFLGAGKTTLLNRLIAAYPDKKFAIIENEFGEVPIDNDLVVDADQDIFELSNGCVCCTLNAALGDTMQALLSSGKHFDHLLVETTGIADPAGVMAAFVADARIQQYFRMDGTITLVDAQFVEDALGEDEVAARQIAFADLLLLNKVEQVAPEYAAQVAEKVRQLNPYAEVVPTSQADFGDRNVLALRAYDADRVESRTAFIHHHHHHHHHHLASESFAIPGDMDPLKLEHWLTVLLQLQGEYLYRVKGIFSFPDVVQKVIFQAVRTQSLISFGSLWSAGEPRLNRVVFIGKDLKRDILERRLRQCLL